ncbi:uncharacterized protein LOC117811213 isoform X1 [Xyrichtys novacula]|uniref:Uncharacterized protein LOC117811213 isoform X1 n=1 Tax=Xyrichtys novacula TaxID=13765 RepID=A0AAV1G0L5_XYRNO|nr:uncharacterized protein LOC117811213 isoform X1 [Xyrichtys novacula]
MKDANTVKEKMDFPRQALLENYVDSFLQVWTEVGPCRDERLLGRAAHYLQREPDLRGIFTLFPFNQCVQRRCQDPSLNFKKALPALIKASELLETLCVNIFLQPWKKEIKTLKTFTGPFVYCLLPVFSSSTIQSVLASIGYKPHTDTPSSEYRLCDDVDTDKAKLVGFELMLVRVECHHLLELYDRYQAGQQRWLDILHERLGLTKREESTDKTTAGQNEEETKKEEEERKEIPLQLDSGFAVKQQPKPLSCKINSEDQSIMEMQMTYPDLAFRGRPLLPDKPHRAISSRSSGKAVHTASINIPNNSNAADLPRGDLGSKASASTIYNHSNVHRAHSDGVRCSDCNDRNCGAPAGPATVSSGLCKTEVDRADDKHGHSQALNHTTRAGSPAEQSSKPGQHQSRAEPPASAQQQTAADNNRHANQQLPSLSPTDMQDLRELEERMGQLHLQETKEEVRRKHDDMRGGEKTNKDRRKKEKKTSTDGKVAGQTLKMPMMETGPTLSHAAGKCPTSSESGPTVMKAQTSPSQPTLSTADQSYQVLGQGQQVGEDHESTETGRGDEEQLAKSYVFIEHHKK